jgi:SAM-dependent methyltransferase
MGYYDQNVGHVWGGKIYREKYGTVAKFDARDFPFALEEIDRSGETVLEIGSSMGQAYRSLLAKGIDLGKRYTGTDISNDGIEHCRRAYPQANWVHGDFATLDFDGPYDYVYERISIHHMPNPFACVKKAIGLTGKKLQMQMRVRSRYPTLSNFERGYFRQMEDDNVTEKGRYFFNLMNVFELRDQILSTPGVASVTMWLARHFKILPEYHIVAPADVHAPEEFLYICRCLVTKGPAARPRVRVLPSHWRNFIRDREYLRNFLRHRRLLMDVSTVARSMA